MVQLIVENIKGTKSEVLYINSKDKLEKTLESCCEKYCKIVPKGIKYRVVGATYDTKSEFEILKPYLFEQGNGNIEI